MRKFRSLRLAAAGAALAAGAFMTTPAHAVPIYPMLFVTINAPVGGAVTYTIDAQAPVGWTCVQLTWTNGVYHLRCQAPVAPVGFENTCIWNVVKVQATGVAGNLYGQSHCDGHPGASASTPAPGAQVGTAQPNLQFTYAYCRANSGATDALVRPWTVRCSMNH